MAVTPNTEIKLLKVPIEIDNKNQLSFTNATAQYNYFNSLPKIEIDKCTYQRKDNIIRFPAHIDSIINYNYVMYQNKNYTNKWFYAFIINMEYINDNLTNITIATDVFQTWQFDFIFKQSFIEREMLSVEEDVPGANLLPENLETGEYKVQGTAEIDDLEPWYVVAYADDTYGFLYNGIYSGINFYIFSDAQALRGFLLQINQGGHTNFIINIFTVPKLALNPKTQMAGILDDDFKATPRSVNLISTPSTLDGYTPRNQKLRTYPFLYVGFNPNNGASKLFRYEDFTNGTPSFKIISEINPNPSVYVIPQNYRGATGDSLSDVGIISGYPTISWANDTFNVWLAQNKDIVNLQMGQEQDNFFFDQIGNISGVAGSLGTAIGGFGGNPGKAITGAVSQAGNSALNYARTNVNHEYYQKLQMAQVEKQRKLPNTGTFGSSNATLLGYEMLDKNIFTRYSIKRQFAERIDKFFDMYGYLTNTVKIPNLNNRPNWNYVKTIGANILGDIPQEDLQALKDIFDNGITIWHNQETFLDYSQNNR